MSHAGRAVTLYEGPAYAVGAVAGALAGGAGSPAVVAGLGAAAFGGLDDLVGDSSSKGLRGHLAAAGRGELTTGLVKIVGLGATGLCGARMIDRAGQRQGVLGTLVGGAVIAGSANIVNLLDLRPGRAGKATLLAAGLVLTRARGWPAAGVAGATAAMLPADLGERVMLGDTGANALGAALGTAIAAAADRPTRTVVFAAVVALTELSERMSFSAGIEAIPALRWLDSLGRLA